MRILKVLTIILFVITLVLLSYPSPADAYIPCFMVHGCGYWLTECEAIDPVALVGSWFYVSCRHGGCPVDCMYIP